MVLEVNLDCIRAASAKASMLRGILREPGAVQVGMAGLREGRNTGSLGVLRLTLRFIDLLGFRYQDFRIPNTAVARSLSHSPKDLVYVLGGSTVFDRFHDQRQETWYMSEEVHFVTVPSFIAHILSRNNHADWLQLAKDKLLSLHRETLVQESTFTFKTKSPHTWPTGDSTSLLRVVIRHMQHSSTLAAARHHPQKSNIILR
ncbi:hypothetical protein IW262DRAFT_1290960 [Armillaria fumosa]|nr:hypothetical protein IW262DRAFT_1290960 [Armillaria fumosa]